MIMAYFIRLLFISVLLFSYSASAATSPWVSGNETQVRLISSGTDAGKLQLGVQFKLAPDWKIYWRTPGDAGMAPSFDWHGSTNSDLSTPHIYWPVPTRFTDPSGIQDFVYYN